MRWAPLFTGETFSPRCGRAEPGPSRRAAGQARVVSSPDAFPGARPNGRGVGGEILAVDRFGNAVTNLRPADPAPEAPRSISAGGRWGPCGPITRRPRWAPVVLTGSWGFVELSIRDGNFARSRRARPGTPSMSSEILQLHLNPRPGGAPVGGHLWVFLQRTLGGEGGRPRGFGAPDHDRGQALGVGYYNPASLIAWRLLSREGEEIDAAFFARRLDAARLLREKLFPGESSYRLCFGESDGLPGLVIDRYEDVFVIQAMAAGIDRRLRLIGEALGRLFKPRGIFLKNDHKSRVLEGLLLESRPLSGEVPPRVLISEGACAIGFPWPRARRRLLFRPA